MENLEEVLQALDEFQKMRPTEIPRELEEYLCWVAKTGDPVYQWPLIKTLFREKLTRVMTDFYESCPTLELASCPNVEHFNYDTMKSNLLERLESFANAPFTVQRICELLTAPRKEYNRVDKFMRAIEKNILVVSTKEPGPIARRSENGDGMVNGSVDEDASVTQPPQDVEMEYWEKDCPSTVTISVHTVENDAPLLHTVIPTTTVVKNVFGNEESSQEKLESNASKSDMAASNFIPTTSEFSGVSSLVSQPPAQDPPVTPTVQNVTTIVPENSGIVGDVPEAIMNEDTSSQPSLDLENEESEATDATRKLQTTFQAKDFTANEGKSTKFYLDNSKVSEKADVGATVANMDEESASPEKCTDLLVKSDCKTDVSDKECADSIEDNILKTTNGKLEDKTKADVDAESVQTIVETPVTSTEDKPALPLDNGNAENGTSENGGIEDAKTGPSKSCPSDKNGTVSPVSVECAEAMVVSPDDSTHNKTAQPETSSKEPAIASTSSDMSVDEDTKDQNLELKPTEDSKPIIEEPSAKENEGAANFNCDREKDGLTITEAVEEDESRITKSIVPDPIPIIEEPKEPEPIKDKADSALSVVEISENSESQAAATTTETEDVEKLVSAESSGLTELQGNDTVTTSKVKDGDSTVIESGTSKRGCEAVELMEVDDEEALSMFQQDEPMEQETTDLAKS